MQTENYPHKVVAVYKDGATAEAAAMALDAADLDDVTIVRLAPGDSAVDLAIEPETRGTRDTLVKDTVAGAAGGTAAGAVAGGAAALATPALFLSAPVVGPLIVLGYGAMIGSAAGAIRGLRMRETVLASLVKDALDAGCYCLIVHAANKEAEHRAREVVDATVTEETAQT
ncbi:MAG: hypothetical protein PVF08_10250 [Gammaproteobacteria bacterium]|jgi:hypothetical protein